MRQKLQERRQVAAAVIGSGMLVSAAGAAMRSCITDDYRTAFASALCGAGRATHAAASLSGMAHCAGCYVLAAGLAVMAAGAAMSAACLSARRIRAD